MHTKRRSAAWKRGLSTTGYGLVTRTLFRATTPPRTMHERFERLATTSRKSLRAKYPNLVFEDHWAGDTWMESVRAVESPRRVVLYLHGGGFLFGSTASYRNRAMRVSYRGEAEVFVPDYRRAPQHPYPAALNDAVAAFEHVRALRPDAPIVVVGDSAGGGLVLSLLSALRDRGAPLPAAAVALSPWADLLGTGASLDGNDRRDVWLSRQHLEHWGRHYIGEGDPTDPGVSPVYADPTGWPPLMLLAGDREVLLDDTRRVEAAARAAGVDVEVCIGRDMQHDWPLTMPWLDEAREAWKRIGAFLDRCAVVPSIAAPVREERQVDVHA